MEASSRGRLVGGGRCEGTHRRRWPPHRPNGEAVLLAECVSLGARVRAVHMRTRPFCASAVRGPELWNPVVTPAALSSPALLVVEGPLIPGELTLSEILTTQSHDLG